MYVIQRELNNLVYYYSNISKWWDTDLKNAQTWPDKKVVTRKLQRLPYNNIKIEEI